MMIGNFTAFFFLNNLINSSLFPPSFSSLPSTHSTSSSSAVQIDAIYRFWSTVYRVGICHTDLATVFILVPVRVLTM